MRNEEIINRAYKEAVAELNETILNDKDLWYSYVINMPLKLQIVYTIMIFDQQVSNGGLHQYFFNPYGQFTYLTIDHLKLIAAFKTSSILESAVSEINVEKFNINEFRTKVFNKEFEKIINFDDSLCSFLHMLDDEYDNSDEDLEQLLANYLQSR